MATSSGLATSHRPPKPLWGFGLIGWLLLPVAAALLAACITDHPLWFDILWVINKTLGTRAMWWCSGLPLAAHWLSMLVAEFNLISLLYVPIALHVYPGRVRWWWYAAIVSCAIVGPIFVVCLPTSWFWWHGILAIPIPAFVPLLAGNLVAVVLLRCATQSFQLGAALLVIFLAAAASTCWIGYHSDFNQITPFDVFLQRWTRVFYHGGNTIVLLVWAVQARRSVFDAWRCQSCGYDLRGSAGGACSECGAPRTHSAPIGT